MVRMGIEEMTEDQEIKYFRLVYHLRLTSCDVSRDHKDHQDSQEREEIEDHLYDDVLLTSYM